MIAPGNMQLAGIDSFPKQYILSEKAPRIPGAKTAHFAGWTIASAPHVPLCPLLSAGRQIGLLVGWLVHEGQFIQTDTPLDLGPDAAPLTTRRASGRYAFLWQGKAGLEFHLDTAGLLPAVLDRTNRRVGATPAILSTEGPIAPDPEIWPVFDFPKHRGFYPFGLTPWRGIERLMPNHALMLADFSVRRIWPIAGEPLEDSIADPQAALADAAVKVRETVEAILRAGRSALYLSGGHDSRMVLAAAHRMPEQLMCETVGKPADFDVFIARTVCRSVGLHHDVLEPVKPTDAEVAGWLDRTGWCILDPVTYHVATAKRHDRGFHPMTGTCAEILRASNWDPEDLGQADLPLDILLARLRLPPVPAFTKAAQRWLEELPAMRRTAALDVAKIEMIHGCWAATSVYGHDIVHPSLHPMNDGLVYDIAMGLPETYKMANTAYRDFIAPLWPELLQTPANKVSGLNQLRFPKMVAKKAVPKTLLRRIKPYR